MAEHLLQHGDDLDFVQDVLSATGGNPELNPILNAVLAGFARRKRSGRFKCGQLNLDFDRLRYANTSTPKDSDLAAKEVIQNSTGNNKVSDGSRSCNFFQRPAGCLFGANCKFQHQCVICGSQSHGAIACKTKKKSSSNVKRTGEWKQAERNQREQERPPHPRSRRERAN